jgi:hypothetical protein
MTRTARQLLDAAQSEADYQEQIVQLAEFCGWYVWHDKDSRRNEAGFPDLMIVRGIDLHFLEVKAQRGRVRPAQQAFIYRLQEVRRCTAGIVRPSDWPAVEAMLTRPAR